MNIKLLKNLNFAEKVNMTEAVTDAGKKMLNNYRSYLYSNPASFGLVNGFVNEASNFSFDTGLVSILESVQNFIKDNNISWKLASTCESIENSNSQYSYINKIGAQRAEKLLDMNEAEVVSYIKAGSLKGLQYIPEFRNICKEVFTNTITETKNLNYVVTNPISYVKIVENAQYFNILGKTYKIENNKISESACDDANFRRINALLEGFNKDEENIYFDYTATHGDKCRFSMNENGLTFTKGSKINESFNNSAKFGEYCNMISKTMPIHEKMNFMTVANNVAKVFEAIDNIVVLDCAKLLQCSNGTICAIVEAKDNVNLTVFRSIGQGTSSKNYDFVVEALNNVVKITGVDLTDMFESRINEDCKKNSSEMNEIKEQLQANKDAQMSIRKKKIAMLAEKHKNDPVRIALLNNAARELNILENEK